MEKNSAPLAVWDIGSGVHSIAISPDGSRVISGLEDGSLRVVDAQKGQLLLAPLKAQNGGVRAVLSPDGTCIVSGSWDKSICIWDAQAGLLVAGPLRGHTRDVSSLAFSPDGTHVVSGSNDGTIRMWDLATKSTVAVFSKVPLSPIHVVAFSPDGTHIASSSFGAICIWDVHTREITVGPLNKHSRSINSMAFFPDGTRIISGSSDRTIHISDVETGATIGEPLVGHTSYVSAVAISSDGTRIVSGSWDTTIRVWDVETRTQIGMPFQGHTGLIKAVAFSPDGLRIYSGSSDMTIRVWDVLATLETGESIEVIDPVDVTETAFSEAGLLSYQPDAAAQGYSTPQTSMGGGMSISSGMSALEMFHCLLEHGCIDVSSRIDPSRYSSVAIAGGGFGDIWAGKMHNGDKVAIKCLRFHTISEDRPKGFKRMMREIYMWSKAKHPNVHELMGVIMFQGRLGMVSLWMENGDLLEYIRKNPGVDRYPLCVQIAAGISYLHDIQMIHGDIKALNILVSQDGVAKLSDFDHSILSSCSLVFSATTNVGGGTLRWMAPELLLRTEDENAPPAARTIQTDIYALGMTMLEILTGKVPYSEYGQDMGVYRALDRKQPPIRPKEIPSTTERTNQLWVLLLQCWDPDPGARPSASSVLTTLESLPA